MNSSLENNLPLIENQQFLKLCNILATINSLNDYINSNEQHAKYLKQVDFDIKQKRKVPKDFVNIKPSNLKQQIMNCRQLINEANKQITSLIKEIDNLTKFTISVGYRICWTHNDGMYLEPTADNKYNLNAILCPEIKRYSDEYLAQKCIEEMLEE